MDKQTLSSIRYVLELVVILSPLLLGITNISSILGLLIGLLVSAMFYGVWKEVGTPGDPVRLATPTIVINGKIRIFIELFMITLSGIIYIFANYLILTVIMILGFLILYYYEKDRVRWLLNN